MPGLMMTLLNVLPAPVIVPPGAELMTVPARLTEPLVVMPSDCVEVPGAARSVDELVVKRPTSA